MYHQQPFQGHPTGFPVGFQQATIVGEGSVVRDKSTGAIYRIIGGQKCHYPNMDVYTSHGKPAYVDMEAHQLTGFANGANILPVGVTEGQVVRDSQSGKIYRVMNGLKCHYPNMDVYTSHGKPPSTNFLPQVLASIVDGPSIAMAIGEGSVVRDKSNGKIYRIIGGRKCHYPNMGTYESYGKPAYLDMESYQLSGFADGLNILPNGIYEGQVVRDTANGKIYRVMEGKKCHFPDTTVYASHGNPPFTNYAPQVMADIVDGPSIPMLIGEGSVVRDKSNGRIFKIINGLKCHYPNPTIYTAHGAPHVTDFDAHVLAPIPEGHPILPPGIYEGSVVRDQANGAIYRIINGLKCHYPNPEVYTAHGKPACQEFQAGLVAAIPDGPSILPPGFYEGQVVRNKGTGAIYKISFGKKCHFPNMNVYNAHGAPAYTDFDPHFVTQIADGPSF
jgi:hypothetical protein